MSRFAVIPTEAGDRCKGDAPALAVLYALALHADKQGRCWPSRKTISEITGLTERGVQNILKRLEDRQVIVILQKGTGRNPSIYSLKCDYWEGRTTFSPGENDVPPRGEHRSPEHTIEHTMEHIIKTKRGAGAVLLPDDWKPDPANWGKLSERYADRFDCEAVLEAFTDYWHSRGDTKAKKRDWDAALRVWFSNEAKRSTDNGKRFNSSGQRRPAGLTDQDRRRLLDSQDRCDQGRSSVFNLFDC